MEGHRAGGAFGVGLVLASGVLAQQQQPAVPDAPTPQAPTALPGTEGPITPGSGSGAGPSGPNSSSTTGQPQPAASSAARARSQPAMVQQQEQTTPPEEGNAATTRFVVQVNFVEVPVTVKDSKGNLVAGLTWRDFTVYENNVREQLRRLQRRSKSRFRSPLSSTRLCPRTSCAR